MSRVILGIAALLLGVEIHAQQNLVPNSGFEDVSGCPLQSYITDAPPWQSTGGGTSPDLFNECFPPLIVTVDTLPVSGVPENGFGQQQAHSGLGYAGIYTGNDSVLSFPGNVREYLQVQLLEPIHVGIRYEVSFFVSLADDFWYGIGTLGAYFSQSRIERNDYFVFEVEPSIESPADIVYTDKENWVEVRDTFVSRTGGGEQWLLIGNFRADTESQLTFVDSGATINHYKSYYYIDDVSVIALDSVPNSIEEVENDRRNFKLYPNPNNGQFTFMYELNALVTGEVRVFDMVGKQVFTQTLNNEAKTVAMNLSQLKSGMYLISLEVNNEIRFAERLSIFE